MNMHNYLRKKKYQIALNRYWARKKTKWEIGRDFERFVGYNYEKNGFNVEYFGATQGLEDFGRDLICEKNGITHIVQCKNIGQSTRLYMKNISISYLERQLCITVQLNKCTKNLNVYLQSLMKKEIVPVFITSIKLSDEAREFRRHIRCVI